MKMLMLATTAAMIEQFNKDNILILEKMGYEVHVAGNFIEGNPISEERLEQFKTWITEHNGKWFNLPSTRRPFDFKGNGKALQRVIELINENHYDFIHCHTPLGSVIGRIAAHRTHTRIIYTAHGFHFYKGAPLKNWLLYYPIERFLSRWTDVLITINKEDYERASSKFHARKTMYVPGIGVDTEKFAAKQSEEKRIQKRAEIGVPSDAIMMISVGELIPRKNHIVAVKALQQLPKSYWYVIVGKGELGSEFLELDNTGRLVVLGYRTDVSDLLWSSDLFLFPSLQEGLPVALMEAMAAELPCLVSKIRGNVDLISDDEKLFEPNDVQMLVKMIKNITLGKCHYEILSGIDIDVIRAEMKSLYEKMGEGKTS